MGLLQNSKFCDSPFRFCQEGLIKDLVLLTAGLGYNNKSVHPVFPDAFLFFN